MSENADVQHRTGAGEAGASADSDLTQDETADSMEAPSAAAGPSEAVLGPFTAREAIFGGGVLLVFIGTLLPFIDGRVLYSTFWSSASLFFIGIGILLPIVAVSMLAGRRLGSSGLRVGSLTVDQFASVTAVLAATYFFLQTVTAFHLGPFLALLGSLGMVAATVIAPFLPVLKTDFVDRPEVPAHPVARPMTASVPRPKRVEPEAEDGPSELTSSDHPLRSEYTVVESPAVGSPADPTEESRSSVFARAGAGLRRFGRAKDTKDTGDTFDTTDTGGTRDIDPQEENPSGEAIADTGPSDVTPSPSSGGRGTAGAGAAAVVGGSSVLSAGGSSTSSRDEPDLSGAAAVSSASSLTSTDGGQDHDGGADGSGDRARKGTGDTTVMNTSSTTDQRVRQEPITATRAAEEESVVEAFWFAVGSPRPVFDERTGREIFTLQPGDWEVGIEDRGREFLVQDKRSGVVGILRDLRNIERAPRD